MGALTKWLDNIKISEPLFLRNLVIYPLKNGEEDGGSIKVLNEVLKEGFAEISEVSSQDVERIRLDNPSEYRIFLLDGEEIEGALQNRITNTACLIDRRSSIDIPVSCVEQGRWSGNRLFRSSDSCAYPSLRKILAKTTLSSLRKSRRFSSDQTTIWKEVEKRLTTLKVKSYTSSMHDLYTTLSSEIERYTEGVEALKGFSGIIGAFGSKIIGLDLFSSPLLFNKLSKKLLESYAIEVLDKTQIRGEPSLREANRFLSRLKKIKEAPRFPSIGLGEEIRFGGKGFIGRGLIFDNSLLHLAAFS